MRSPTAGVYRAGDDLGCFPDGDSSSLARRHDGVPLRRRLPTRREPRSSPPLGGRRRGRIRLCLCEGRMRRNPIRRRAPPTSRRGRAASPDHAASRPPGPRRPRASRAEALHPSIVDVQANPPERRRPKPKPPAGRANVPSDADRRTRAMGAPLRPPITRPGQVGGSVQPVQRKNLFAMTSQSLIVPPARVETQK